MAAVMGVDEAVVEAHLQQVLEEAGLESAPFDPASLQALKKHVQKSVEAGKPLLEIPQSPSPLQNMDIYGPTTAASNIVMAQQQQPPPVLNSMESDMTDPGSSVRPNNTNNSNISGLSMSSSLGSKTEARILEQLQVQTALILQLQRRVDDLTEKVQQQQHPQHAPPPTTVAATTTTTPLEVSTQNKQETTKKVRKRAKTTKVAPPTQQDKDDEEEEAQTEPEEPPTRGVQARGLPADQNPPARGFLTTLLASPWILFRNSRLYQLARVFEKMRRREVQEMQWGVIIKLLIMMTILFSRMVSSSKRQAAHKQQQDADESVWNTIPVKFYMLVAVVLLGFLGQNGYLGFLHKFIVKERYPYRILVQGDDVDEILQELEPLHPGPRRRNLPGGRNNNNNNNNAAAGNNNNNVEGGQRPVDLNDTFVLGGRIAEPQVAQGLGIGTRLWNGILDILYLFGSFFLSIFPMWRPQAPPRPADQQAPTEDANLDNQEEPPPDNNNNNNNPGDQGPGRVRPPVDPAAGDD